MSLSYLGIDSWWKSINTNRMPPSIVNLTCVFPRRNQASELLGFCWTAPSKRSTALGMSPEKIREQEEQKIYV